MKKYRGALRHLGTAALIALFIILLWAMWMVASVEVSL